MKRRQLILSIVLFVGVVGSIFTFDLISRRTPVLGLDLRGGLSVIYAPEASVADQVTEEDLEFIRDKMRTQLEAFGIAEPDVRVEGGNIVADLPGVNDQESAFDALKVSGIVELRPVMGCLATPSTTDTSVSGDTVPGSDSSDPNQDEVSGTDDSVAPDTTVDTTSETGDVEEEGLGYFGNVRPAAATPDTLPDDSTPTGTIPTGTIPTGTIPVGTVPIDVTSDGLSVDPIGATGAEGQTILPYPKDNSQCLVGPPGGSGEVFQQRSAAGSIDNQTGGWRVTVDLTSVGLVQWNALASQCFNRASTCPSAQLAIVLDGEIITAPVVQTPTFDSNVQITGMRDKTEADNLADVLNRGAFPVQVVPQRTETVSPSAGQDSLNAAIIAGLVGVAIMLVTMVLYYRRLAIIMIVGLVIWGITVFTLATLVSRATNFALTLAGATGIIIAVGVTVDTYVVFFERLRDEMRAGRSLANAAPRGYRATGRTVLSADVVSLLASIVLFALSVGSVRGFALYLGITTVCDLLVFYFFTRPAVLLVGMSRWGKQRPPKTVAVAGAAT